MSSALNGSSQAALRGRSTELGPLLLDLPPAWPSHLMWGPGRRNYLCLLVARQPTVSQPRKGRLHQPGLKHDSGTRSIAIELRCHAQRPKRSVYAAWRHNNHHDHKNYPDTPCTAGRASLLDRRHGGSCGSAVALQPFLGDGQQERLGGCHTALQAVFLYRDHLAENRIVRRPIMSPYGTALGIPASALWETRGGRRLPVASSNRLAHSIPPGQRRV